MCSISRGEGFWLGPTQRGRTVSVTSQVRASVVLTFTVLIVLPPFISGFPLADHWQLLLA